MLRYVRNEPPTSEARSAQALVLLGIILGLLIAIVLLSCLLLMALLKAAFEPNATDHYWLTVAGSTALFLHLLRVGAFTCGRLVKEKRQQIFETLLVLPVDRQELLWPRWVFIFRHEPGLLIVATLLITISYVQFGRWASAFAVGLYPIAAAAFAASVGLWLGIRSNLLRQAMIAHIALAATLSSFPLIVQLAFDQQTDVELLVILTVALAVLFGGSRGLWVQTVRTVGTCDHS